MKTKQLTEYLSLAGVPDGLHAQVLACMHAGQTAQRREVG